MTNSTTTISATQTQLDRDVAYVASDLESRYAQYVDRADVASELYLYALSTVGATLIESWRDDNEQFRIIRQLFTVGKGYCEREKAAKTGSHFSDIAWYSPDLVEALLPFALHRDWDGMATDHSDRAEIAKEGANLVVMVIDVRKAINAVGVPRFDHEVKEFVRDDVERLADFLGGEFPGGGFSGGRQAISNSKAQWITNQVNNLWSD